MQRSRLIALIMGLCVIGDSMLYVTLPASYRDLAIDSKLAGLILSLNRFSRLAFNPLAALLVGKLGYRNAAILSSVLALSCTLGYSVASHPVLWLILRVMWGFTWSLIRLTALLVTLEESPEDRRGQALGSMQRLVRAGSVTGTFAGGFLLDRIGFRPTAMAMGALTSLSIVLALGLRHDTRQGSSISTSSLPARSARAAKSEIISCSRHGWYVYASVLLASIAVGGIFLSTTGVLIRSELDEHGNLRMLGFVLGVGSLSGLVQSFRWLSDILFGPFIGRASDRFGRNLPAAAIFVSQLSAGLIILARQNIYATLMAQAVMYSGHSLALVVLSSAAADLTTMDKASVAMTIYAMCLDFGDAVGPLVAYSLVDLGLARAYSLGVGMVGVLAVTWVYMAVKQKGARACTR